MGTRIELQSLLEDILGSRNVYYQPPSSIRLSYPAIVYKRSRIVPNFADDNPYKLAKAYEITVIDKNPDSVYADKIACLQMCRMNRQFTNDGLYHYVFELYF